MDIYVLDTSLNVVGVVDNFISFIWNERYYAYGDFEIYMVASRDLFDIFQKNRYVAISKSKKLMIIESLKIETDIEDGDKLTVKGRSLESLLERRVVFDQTDVSGNFQNAVKKLITDSIINPAISDRKINNFTFSDSTDPRITPLTLKAQYLGENIYEIISDLCKINNIGFKVEQNGSNFEFSLYRGADRSYSQKNNSYVIFSKSFDNLVNTDYSETDEKYKNVALIGGEIREETPRFLAVTGTATGLERRETFVDASGTSSMKYQGPEQEEEQMDDDEYGAILIQKGKEELAGLGTITDVDAQIEFRGTYTPEEDYFLGDTVQIVDDYNVDSKATIIEMITSYDSDGISVYPTFEVAGTSRLPKEYQEVEYLQSDGFSFIDTEIVPQKGMSAEVEFMFTHYPASVEQVFAYYKGPVNRWQCGGLSGNHFYEDGYFGYSQDDLMQWTIGYGTYTNDESGANMYLFAQDDYNTGKALYPSQARVKSVVVRLDGSLYAHLVPCYRNVGGLEVPGMYDLKRKRFFTNLGTQDLVVGPIVGREVINTYSSIIPDEYEQLEYMEGDGLAYIDTGILTSAVGDRINYEGHFETSTYPSKYMFGAKRYSSNSTDWLYGSILVTDSNLLLQYDTENNTYTKTDDISFNESISENSIDLDVNGTTITKSIGANQETNTLFIYASTASDGSVDIYPSGLKMHYFLVRNDQSIIACYVPVKRRSDNAVGAYNLITGDFILPEDGAFIAGPAATPAYPGPYRVVPEFTDVILPTDGLGMSSDITVEAIPNNAANIEQEDDELSIS